MEKTIDIIKYLYNKYPHPSELSKARLVKLVYLADWKSAITNEKQLTNIKWLYNHYGPYVEDIINEIRNDVNFEIVSGTNYLNQQKDLIKIINNTEPPLKKETKKILDFVILKTKDLYWEEFINLVYSTYPIIKEEKFNHLDLVRLAKEYKNTVQGGV
ncbi:Panacea domain-containing protein [Flavobacteriaceae bacterium]|nr:Panacea domain-containing protein [Flavobacteriaceae bacterium]